jgi:hypothetical protein
VEQVAAERGHRRGEDGSASRDHPYPAWAAPQGGINRSRAVRRVRAPLLACRRHGRGRGDVPRSAGGVAGRGIVLSFVSGRVRQYVRPLLVGIGANFPLGAAIGAGAGVFGASLDMDEKAIYQPSMMGLGALLMVRAMLTKPPYVRLERRLAARPGGSRGSVAPVVFSTLVVGLLGAAAIALSGRLEARRWRQLVGLMVFVFFGYLVALEAGALPQAWLVRSPHAGPDRGVSAIATLVGGITSIVLIARFAIRRGHYQPRPSRVIPAGTAAWLSR